MTNDLTKIYEGADLSGAVNKIIYLPILKDGTLTALDVLTDEAATSDATFSLSLNGVSIAGEDLALGESEQITITVGTKIVSLAGLEIALVKGDEITLDLLSGVVSSPLTLNLSVDDGQSSGGTGGGYAFFDVDAPSPTPDAADDDFETETLATRWTGFNLRTASYNFSDYFSHLRLFCLDYQWTGFAQNVPSGNWKYRAKISLQSSAAEQNAGLFVSDGTKIYAFVLRQSEDNRNLHFELWNSPTNFNTGGDIVINFLFTTIYMEIERHGTDIIFRYSVNGKEFHKIKTVGEGYLGFTVSKIALGTRGDSVQPMLCDWFRKVPANGITGNRRN